MPVSLELNEFLQASDWDVDSHNEAHKRHVSCLNAEDATPERSAVEIMITPPSYSCIHQ